MKLLMCRPTYYGIEYEINPWMNVDYKVNHAIAINQWNTLYDTIQQCGAQVELIEPVKGWPDMVFTANAGLYYQQKIILPHFKYKERQGELAYFKKWFIDAGLELINPDIHEQTPFFEGAGDALLAGNKLFAGYGFRSDATFYKSDFFDESNLIYCELIDPYFYHIDTCFCPLTDELAIWYPSAFSSASQKKMAKEIELIAVTAEEAKKFACNSVVLNKNIILPSGCPQLADTLSAYNFNVHPCDMNEYLKAGGACKCLTLRID